MKKIYLTTTSSQTKKLGEKLAQKIISISSKKQRDRALVLALEGDLGGGKTTFLQGFAKGLEIKQKILSPTFVLMRKFQIPNYKQRFKNFYHFDCYRVQKPKEILDLDFRQIISDKKNIVAVEWADKIKKILPRNIIEIKFEFKSKNTRRISIVS